MSSSNGNPTKTAPTKTEFFTWFERRNDDFPYYCGRPVAISGRQWWIVLLGVALGFAALILNPYYFNASPLRFVPTILFIALPLAALAIVAGRGWTAMFRQLRGIDFVWMVAFCILNGAVTLGIGSVIIPLFETAANPAGQMVAAASPGEQVVFYLLTAVQLFGEELLTVLPFLALLTWLVAHRGMKRKHAIVLAWLASAVIFALAHLHTYDWHLPQALLGIGVVRLVRLVPYIMTKNIWVSTGAHILNDWSIFTIVLLFGGEAELPPA